MCLLEEMLRLMYIKLFRVFSFWRHFKTNKKHGFKKIPKHLDLPLNLRYPTPMQSVHLSTYFILSEHLVRLSLEKSLKPLRAVLGQYTAFIFLECSQLGFQVRAKTLNIKESLHYPVLFCSVRWSEILSRAPGSVALGGVSFIATDRELGLTL